MNKDNITELNGGLHSDNSFQNQPKNTYRFALNTVNETDTGDEFFRSNEGSNEICVTFPEDFIPIGKRYMTNSETIIFLVSKDNAISEIGILKNNCQYETHVNDENSEQEDKLGFSVEHQIDARYRLRRGCERTVYFTDNNKKPRYYNFDKPADFKNDDGTWAGKKFNLFKEYDSIPEFTSIEVLDFGGLIEPGSINISLRYLDEGLNPSEFMITSPIINIYNDLSSRDFLDIQGSINSSLDYIDFPPTSKAIRIELDDLDQSYPFYQLAFIEANSGNGLVSSVKYSETIPTTKNFFVYTGENAITLGTEEEILFFNDIIYKASSIESVDNKLILADTQGKQVNFCKLQKYASRIKADVITKKVITNDINDPSNTKNPTVHFGDMSTGGTGYMPGEIYSFGIVYVFGDGSLSPVFHIPGKNPDVNPTTVFDIGPNTYPMDINNESINNRYIDNDNCENNDYWGLDSEGISLQGKPVRHHRFPHRSELGIPLVKEESSTGEQSFQYYALQFGAVGEICLPDGVEAETCTSAEPFQARVTYTVDGIEKEMVININPAEYSNPINITRTSELYTTDNIVIIKIEEADEDGVITEVTSESTSPKGLEYMAEVSEVIINTEGKIYSTEILGIKFSGIDIPSLEDVNGEEVIGYYIVRNERIENEKTILDSAVLLPVLENNKYVSTGLLTPQLTDDTKIRKDLFGLLHPEHKFNNIEYNSFDYIKQEGNFNINKRSFSKTNYNDVFDGTSYDSDSHKSGNDDGGKTDGFSLAIILRDTFVSFVIRTLFNILFTNIKEVFYLKALESRDINDGANTAYNISADNKIGMIQTDGEIINPIHSEGKTTLPYVILGRNILDSYSNFRILPYYKESINMQKFNVSGDTKANIFNGDTYVTPMRYTNTVFWDNRLAKRGGKSSVWSYVIGGILVAVGAVLTFFTFGASTLVVGAGIAIIGGGVLFISSGIERDAILRAYNEEYKRGLRETALDDWVHAMYQYPNGPTPYPGDDLTGYEYFVNGNNNNTPAPFKTSEKKGWGNDGPSDDEIQWIGDTITDLWFESTVNMSLRNKMVSEVPTFLDAPGIIESGNNTDMGTREFFGLYWTQSYSRYPISKQDYHLNKKLLFYNSEREDNREYIGAPLGEYYEVNPDYKRINKQKIYYHLPLEYDCCTECMEDFPHRWHWSEQSFQEELTDNYRVFLPNNYKDIDGETGRITNVFKLGNDLFMHTEEALWQIPRSFQERVTDQIVSFIGTGSYGEIPPFKVMDDESGSSAGSNHKWGLIKTSNGIFFPSENQRKIYQFSGKQLKPISNIGISNWFQNNMELLINKQYYNSTGRNYIYNDNPSNPFGSGYISTYDTKNERIIFTKKDYLFTNEFNNSDYQICVNNGQVTYFNEYNETIEEYINNGWRYLGIEDCRMKFERTITNTKIETRQITISIANNADIIIWLDTSGSFTVGARQVIKDAIDLWLIDFTSSNPDWTGNLYYLEDPDGNRSERWLISLDDAKNQIYGGNIDGKNIVMVSFVNEANPVYHNGVYDSIINPPNVGFQPDYDNFIDIYDNEIIANGGSFHGLSYPIVFTGQDVGAEYLKHSLAAINGISFTLAEVEDIIPNPGVGDWDIMKTALQTANPYPDNGIGGLNQYGWGIKTNRFWEGSGEIITPEQFQEDMNEFLEGTTVVEEIEVEVTYQENEFTYVDGIIIPNPIKDNNSWTISHSIKQGTWTSWHSYLPNFYLNVPDKFYSWIYGNDNLWLHNKKGNYQTFYDNLYPFIIEYVSLSNPLVTRIWEYITMLVDVKKYNLEFEEFVDINNVFFNKLIAYNSRQCSGLMNIKVKDANPDTNDYLFEQIINDDNEIIVDRNERNWTLNNLRDIRTDYSQPIFISKLSSLQNEYFIDKILNDNSFNYEKDWSELESFRDKYLVVRLIFDNFASNEFDTDGTTKMIMNFSGENETQSFR